MDIVNWQFWYWGIAFVVAPTTFFVLGGRLFPRVKSTFFRNALKVLDVVLLITTCLICTSSFVMFWHKLLGVGFWSPLLCLTTPIALILTFFIWKSGMILLLVKSGVSVYAVDENYDTIFAARPTEK